MAEGATYDPSCHPGFTEGGDVPLPTLLYAHGEQDCQSATQSRTKVLDGIPLVASGGVRASIVDAA